MDEDRVNENAGTRRIPRIGEPAPDFEAGLMEKRDNSYLITPKGIDRMEE